MKKITAILLSLNFILCITSCGKNNSINSPVAKKIWDRYLGEYELSGSEIVLDEFPDEVFTRDSLSTLVIGNVFSFYTCDFTGDGYPELCLGSSVGSGYINESVSIIDYKNKKTLAVLGTRFENDVYLSLIDNSLWITYTMPMQPNEVIKEGKLSYFNNIINVKYVNNN